MQCFLSQHSLTRRRCGQLCRAMEQSLDLNGQLQECSWILHKTPHRAMGCIGTNIDTVHLVLIANNMLLHGLYLRRPLRLMLPRPEFQQKRHNWVCRVHERERYHLRHTIIYPFMVSCSRSIQECDRSRNHYSTR